MSVTEALLGGVSTLLLIDFVENILRSLVG